MKSRELVIIGGGPAGVSAAIEAANRGVSVALIEENEALGGKVLKSGKVKIIHRDKFEYRISNRLLNAFKKASDRIELYLNTEVWAVHEDKIVELHMLRGSDSKIKRLKAATLIIAAGAIERTIPFPGWTLPGVFTVGGLNKFIKEECLRDHKILVAGSGPLLFVLAYNLIKRGSEICAIVLLKPWSEMMVRSWTSLKGAGFIKLWQGINYISAIKRKRIPVFQSHVVIEAKGDTKVEGVRIAKVDDTCRPIPGTEKSLPTDAIGVSYGLIPSLELTRLCGCKHHFDPQVGYWRSDLDENFETTVPGIFMAGDGVRINGYEAAIIEGRAAAVSACVRLGKLSPKEGYRIIAGLKKKLKRVEKFTYSLDEYTAPGKGLIDIVTDKTIVCRCEEVTLAQIRTAVADGARDVNDIKRRTRCGMGYCQGRFCGQVINELIWKLTDNKKNDRELFTKRIPVKPVPFSVFETIEK